MMSFTTCNQDYDALSHYEGRLISLEPSLSCIEPDETYIADQV